MTEPVKRMFVRDVAAHLDRSVSAARATMVRLERKHGIAVIRREGSRMYTDQASLDAALSGRSPAGDVDRTIARLVEGARADRRQLRSLATANAELRHLVEDLAAGQRELRHHLGELAARNRADRSLSAGAIDDLKNAC